MQSMIPPQKVSIDEAKSQLSDLITIASEGGEVIIVQDGKPLARLVSAADTTAYHSLPAGRARCGYRESLRRR